MLVCNKQANWPLSLPPCQTSNTSLTRLHQRLGRLGAECVCVGGGGGGGVGEWGRV